MLARSILSSYSRLLAGIALAGVAVAGGFAYLADNHARASVNGRQTYIGLDIENDSLSSNGALMVAEINRARYAGAQGVSVFSAQIMARNNWWHILPQTVFKKKATVPPMSWK